MQEPYNESEEKGERGSNNVITFRHPEQFLVAETSHHIGKQSFCCHQITTRQNRNRTLKQQKEIGDCLEERARSALKL